jgi:hypothetical protein
VTDVVGNSHWSKEIVTEKQDPMNRKTLKWMVLGFALASLVLNWLMIFAFSVALITAAPRNGYWPKRVAGWPSGLPLFR